MVQTGELTGGTGLANPVSGNGGLGIFTGQIYGPGGQELGGVARFHLYNNVGGTINGTEVSVVTVAKREP